MAISGVNFGAVSATPNNKADKKGLSVKTVAGATAVPVAVGVGYATRFYYENKGKASVYQDLIDKFPKDDTFKSCLKLTEKSQRNAKLSAIGLVVAGVATVLGYAAAKTFGAFDKTDKAPASAKPVKAPVEPVQPAKADAVKSK